MRMSNRSAQKKKQTKKNGHFNSIIYFPNRNSKIDRIHIELILHACQSTWDLVNCHNELVVDEIFIFPRCTKCMVCKHTILLVNMYTTQIHTYFISHHG